MMRKRRPQRFSGKLQHKTQIDVLLFDRLRDVIWGNSPGALYPRGIRGGRFRFSTKDPQR